MPTTEENTPVYATLTGEIATRIKGAAEEEDRSGSNMVKKLCCEALDARDARKKARHAKSPSASEPSATSVK